MGGIDSGHYILVARGSAEAASGSAGGIGGGPASAGGWRVYDDDRTWPLASEAELEASALQQQAYMLLYVRRRAPLAERVRAAEARRASAGE